MTSQRRSRRSNSPAWIVIPPYSRHLIIVHLTQFVVRAPVQRAGKSLVRDPLSVSRRAFCVHVSKTRLFSPTMMQPSWILVLSLSSTKHQNFSLVLPRVELRRVICTHVSKVKTILPTDRVWSMYCSTTLSGVL